MESKNKEKILKGVLYVVSTPIGNLADFSQRGINTLLDVDFIAAEDTRVSIKLLNKFNIKKEMVSYHQHSDDRKENEIINRLLLNESCALISDAGTPAISDPGQELIKACYDNNILVKTVPGPSAVISALSISGQNTNKFMFEGFLSKKRSTRINELKEVSNYPHTLVFYEAPHGLLNTLKDMKEVFSNRSLTIIREMTKIFEESIKTTIDDAIKHYEKNSPKGEFVLVVEGNTKDNGLFSLEEVIKLVNIKMDEGLSMSSACKEVAKSTTFSKGEIYKAMLNE